MGNGDSPDDAKRVLSAANKIISNHGRASAPVQLELDLTDCWDATLYYPCAAVRSVVIREPCLGPPLALLFKAIVPRRLPATLSPTALST